MAEHIVCEIFPQVVTSVIEQKIAAGNDFDGTEPALGAAIFLPYCDSKDNIYRMKHPTIPATDEGDAGGLFTFAHDQVVVIEQIFADFGTSVSWTINIVTSAGDMPVWTGTGQHAIVVSMDSRARIVRGEALKLVTSGATNAMWARVYARLEQAISI